MLTRVGLLILKILVLVLIGWVFWPQFRWNEFADAFARTSAPTALVVLTLFGFQAVMAALRWRWILHRLGYPLTTGASVEAWLVGQCASQRSCPPWSAVTPLESFGCADIMFRPPTRW